MTPSATANTYTVVYNGNGNTGGSTASSLHTYGTAKNLTANGFTKICHNFSGWATSAGGAKVYNNSQSVSNLTTTNGGSVNLFAVWTVAHNYVKRELKECSSAVKDANNYVGEGKASANYGNITGVGDTVQLTPFGLTLSVGNVYYQNEKSVVGNNSLPIGYYEVLTKAYNGVMSVKYLGTTMLKSVCSVCGIQTP